MTRIILDFGSANTCKNDIKIVKRMIDELVKVDSKKYEVIIKWQLFEKAGENIPLNWGVFKYAYDYAKEKGYQTTASVFDLKSLKYLLEFEVPFIKVSNRPDLYWLIGYVPRNIQIYASGITEWKQLVKNFICVSKYPAELKEYEELAGSFNTLSNHNISDHTATWDLFNKYKPSIYECHYKLPDSTGLDAGSFARTPEQLKEIL